jgi:SNF2 family DNA or RNA helicase
MSLLEYEWPRPHGFTPFAHQQTTAEFLVTNRKAFCFNEQGTGKTASVIWAVDYLMQRGLVNRVLVICPLSIMKSAWQNDLFKFAIHRTVAIAYGAADKRRAAISSNAEFVIINFDGVGIVKKEIAAGGFDLVVVDEASAYKNPQTDRWKDLRDLMKTIKGLWMLTGTPAAQSPVDAYGLAKLVNPQSVSPFYGQFRDSVMQKVSEFRWIPRPDAQNTVHRILQPAIRFEKAQCLDLPPVTYVYRDAPLTPQQLKYYNTLKKQMLIEAAGEEVSAVNAAVRINKLLQIAGGAVYTDSGEIIEFDVSQRLQVIREVIEESNHKVLVFVPFTHTIELLQKYLEKHHVTCEVINGSVSVNKRTDIVSRFQSQETPKVLIIQPQAASHGLTLTAADTIIWYAPCSSVETYLQANARIDRPGQVNNMTVVHINGSPVERKMYALLQGNIDNHNKVIDLYRQEISSDDS